VSDLHRANEAKREMRREMRAFLGTLARDEIARKSEAICHALALGLDDLIESATTSGTGAGTAAKANAAMFYAPGADEPDPGLFASTCASRGMPIAAPVIEWDAKTMAPAKIDTLPGAPAVEGPNEIPPLGTTRVADTQRCGEPEATPNSGPLSTPPGWTIRRHGIREPDSTAPLLPLHSLAVVFVPGLAFDSSGNRLGRGAGFYDRFLARAELRHVLKIGVAFAGQIRPIVPIMPGDIAMDGVVTDAGFVWVT
jgi:5-formyltetrahydrofolate cyclo-ligase